jgi:hypothetical protein
MNLQDYTIKHGTKELRTLAEICGISALYLSNLLYAANNAKYGQIRTPSIKTALKLVKASNGELCMEGLASPVPIARNKKRV